MRALTVPVTPSVIQWAIDQSGHPLDELSLRMGVDPSIVQAWITGDEKPKWTEVKKLAEILRRPAALFFLPEPPSVPLPRVGFRYPHDSNRKRLNPVELRYLREATRLQKALSWLRQQIGERRVELPKVSFGANVDIVGDSVRRLLEISVASQSGWSKTSHAFVGWRKAFEAKGIHVFLFSLGPASSRGFSLWNTYAPIVAINTRWNAAARIFTMFHELGHLLTRTDSMCLNPSHQVIGQRGDAEERWCERFAAAALMPKAALERFLTERLLSPVKRKIESLDDVRLVSNYFNVSLASSALRLIETGKADWELYQEIPPASDEKRGGGGTGRDRKKIREDSYGDLTTDVFLNGVKHDLITRYDVMSYLDVADSHMAQWEGV